MHEKPNFRRKKNISGGNMLFGEHQALMTGHNNKRQALADCLAKLMVSPQQDATEGKQSHQQ